MHLEEILNPEAFWQYSLTTYQQLEVKELCLLSQEQFDLNVNVILLCGWLNRFDKTLKVNQLELLLSEIAGSQSELKDLRRLRNDYMKDSEAYKACLGKELQHEALQQQQLLNTLAGFTLLAVDRHPLSVYFEWAQCNDSRTCKSKTSIKKTSMRKTTAKQTLQSLIAKMETTTEGKDDDCNIRL